MLPRLYQKYGTQGPETFLGTLDRCTKCLVTEEREGTYILELETTVNDTCASALLSLRILEVKANPFDPPQCFEIEKTERTLDGRIVVEGKHIKDFCFQYFTNGMDAAEDTAVTEHGDPEEIWNILHSDYITLPNYFNFHSTITTEKSFSLGLTTPESLGNILAGKQGSFVDVWGGELHYDNHDIYFNQIRGRDTGFQLRYGSNISDASQSENCDSAYTHILPYGYVTYINESHESHKIHFFAAPVEIANHEANIRRRVFPLDCTDFLEAYTVGIQGARYAETRTAMQSYAADYAVYNGLGKRRVSIDVTLRVELDRMANIGLCDNVTVVLTPFGSVTTAKVVKVIYNSLLERWEEITVGKKKTTIADLFLNKERYVK